MQRKNPMVKDGRLYRAEVESDPIDVGTPAWYDWLEQHTAFTFFESDGTFTARKNMLRTGRSYWIADCTRQGKLSRIYLGHSPTLTLEKLKATAHTFAGEQVSGERDDASSEQSAASEITIHTAPRKTLTVDHSRSLLQTKLSAPHSHSDLITRPRLLERLNDGLSGNVTLVCAPAGCGKTTLLAEWVQTINRLTAWLSLDTDDNELRLFVHSLAAALQTALSGTFQTVTGLLTAPRYPPPVQLVKLFIDDLADVPDDVVLVLDDYHFIGNHEIHTLLELLIEHLPPQLHLVLSSRSDPPLPLARWRAKGILNELRSADLLFLLDETEAFLTRVLGSVVAHEAAVALEERTEGWIAILRLAALSLRGIPDRTAFMERLRHFPDHTMSSYLVEELLDQLAPAVQELLEQTSILEPFCAELCVAVMGNEISLEQVQAFLDYLERANIFLVSLDDRQGWYRFHHLFKGLLEYRLQSRLTTEGLATLHRHASAWYAEHALIKEAIEHALAAGDAREATKLVEAQFFWAFEREQWVQMERWLRLLPEDQIQGSPSLIIALVWTLLIHGKLTDIPRLLRVAERLLGTTDSSANDADRVNQRLLRALIGDEWSVFQYFNGQVEASLESARSALDLIPPGEKIVVGHVQEELAFSLQANGQVEDALATLQQALQNQAVNPRSTVRLLFAQAIIYLVAGKLHQAEHTARHLLHIAQQAELPLSQYWAHCFLGVVSYEWNNLDAAIYHCSVVIANQHQAHIWAGQDALCILALTYQAKGLGTQAQETSHALLALVQEQHNMPQLMTAYAFCGRLALLQNNVEQAAQWFELAGEQDIRGPMLFLEDPPVTKAWMFLAQGDEGSVTHGQALLETLLQHVERMHNTRKTIQVLALQAWAYDLQGCAREALNVLERALTLARSNGFIRTFADLPQLSKVLQNLRTRRKALQEVDQKFDTYLQDLLAVMSSNAVPPVSTEALLRQEGLESLTGRELQILRLLDQGLSNKEIARALVLTTGTVKVHTSNVYRKLGVSNRRTAVSLAKVLGLLATDPDQTQLS